MIQEKAEDCDRVRILPGVSGANPSDPFIMYLDLNATEPIKSHVYSINKGGFRVGVAEKSTNKGENIITIEGEEYQLSGVENGKIQATKGGVEKDLLEYLKRAEAKKRHGLFIDTYNGGRSVLWSEDEGQDPYVLGGLFANKQFTRVENKEEGGSKYYEADLDGKTYQIKYVNGLFQYREGNDGDFARVPQPETPAERTRRLEREQNSNTENSENSENSGTNTTGGNTENR
jgi:hypothetical protein